MKTLMTVLGPLEAEKLGYCQMHEHLFVRKTPASATQPALCVDDETRLSRRRRRVAAGRPAHRRGPQSFRAFPPQPRKRRPHRRRDRLPHAHVLPKGTLDFRR